VYEQTVGTVPYVSAPLGNNGFSEQRVSAGIKRAIAKGTVLSDEMRRVIRTFRIGTYTASFDFLSDSVLDTFHIDGISVSILSILFTTPGFPSCFL